MAVMSRFAILLGGDLVVTPRLRRQIAGARIIAADSGMKHASALGLMPELWVGDFDSAGSELLLDYALVPRQTHAADKDATDGEIAVSEALRLGATEIVLIGGLGGESDHATAHLGMALHLARSGQKCFISTAARRLTLTQLEPMNLISARRAASHRAVERHHRAQSHGRECR